MDEIELTAQKRAFPSRGRARIHSDALSKLGIEEGAAIEVGIKDAEHWISVTAFADSLVSSGNIRLSEEDLKVLGAAEGAVLRVRRKAALTEQIKGSFGKAGESIKGASVESVTTGTKEAAAGVGASIGKAGHSVSAAFSNAFEAAKKKLKPADAVTLDKALKANAGEVRAVTVPDGTGTRTLGTVKLPTGVVIAAVQRGDAIQTTNGSFVLVGGDIIYLVGQTDVLDEAAKVIGG